MEPTTGLRIDLAGHYARNGYIVGPLLGPTQVRRLVDTSWCYLRSRGAVPSDQTCARPRTAVTIRPGQRPDQGHDPSARHVRNPARPVAFRGIVDQLPAAAEVALGPDTLYLAAHVLGAPRAMLVGSALLYQPPRSGVQSAKPAGDDDTHDPAPTPRLNLTADLTAVIAVDDQFDDGGGLRITPRSHLADQQTHHGHDPHRDPHPDHAAEFTAVLPIGWVAMLDRRLRYTRATNSSDRPRRCLILEYAARNSGGRR